MADMDHIGSGFDRGSTYAYPAPIHRPAELPASASDPCALPEQDGTFDVVAYHVRLCLNLHESCSFGWLVKDGIRCGGSWVFEDGDGVSGFGDGVWMDGVLLLDVCEYFLLVHGDSFFFLMNG